MSKRKRPSPAGSPAGSRRVRWTLWTATAIAAGAMLVSVWTWRESRETGRDVSRRMARMENDVAALRSKLAEVEKAARPAPRRGPDPEKVYAVRTDGAPVRGTAGAPVTVVEVSDFQ